MGESWLERLLLFIEDEKFKIYYSEKVRDKKYKYIIKFICKKCGFKGAYKIYSNKVIVMRCDRCNRRKFIIPRTINGEIVGIEEISEVKYRKLRKLVNNTDDMIKIIDSGGLENE